MPEQKTETVTVQLTIDTTRFSHAQVVDAALRLYNKGTKDKITFKVEGLPPAPPKTTETPIQTGVPPQGKGSPKGKDKGGAVDAVKSDEPPK